MSDFLLQTTLAEDIIIVICLVFSVLVFAYLFALVAFARIVEPTYALIFNKPLFVHLYLTKKPVSEQQRSVLSEYSTFYKALSPARKKYFEHRVNRFLLRYEFHGREELEITDEMRTRIASVYVMLTFGIRNYLTNCFNKVILYPGIFLSQATGEQHKGEYNPRMRAVVFSWDDFLQGCQISNDNLNLGLHEFAHVLSIHCRKDNDVSSVIFTDEYNAIMEELQNPSVRNRIRNSGYLRDYAFTNKHEFLAVILEHFFETPHDFRAILPALYKRIAAMINYDPLKSRSDSFN